MSDYILSCCSTADLSKEHFERRNVNYICFHFAIDGEEFIDDLGQSISYEEFYDRMANEDRDRLVMLEERVKKARAEV